MRKSLLLCGAMMALMIGTVGVAAQQWPNQPVTLMVPFAPGGPLDTLARTVQPYISETLGQRVVVDNQPGAGGRVGSLRLSGAPGDGHTFMLGSQGTHGISQLIFKKPPYNAITDFAPVTLVADAPQVVLVRHDLPANNLREFAALLRKDYAKMQHGSGGTGTSSHIACVLLNEVIGAKVTHVPYKGGGPAMLDLLAGRIDYMCNYISVTLPPHEAKKAKIISALADKRQPLLPEIPTAAEEGFKGLSISAWNAAYMPKATLPAHVRTLNAAINKALENPALQERLTALGFEVPARERRTPEYLVKFMEQEIKRWAGPVQASGMEIN
jgi:tripartite-type tricarboxylate transporter receptor subunit TctC